MEQLKEYTLGFLVFIAGTFSLPVRTLLAIMFLDLVLGIICACMGKSGKTSGGKLSSVAAFEGLVKKLSMICMICAANLVGVNIHLPELRDGVIAVMIATEGLSIVENCVKLGVPVPKKFRKILESLESEDEKE